MTIIKNRLLSGYTDYEFDWFKPIIGSIDEKDSNLERILRNLACAIRYAEIKRYKKNFLINENYNRFPKWVKMVIDGLGSEYRHIADHVYCLKFKESKEVFLICEPYDFGIDDMKKVIEVCEKYNTDAFFRSYVFRAKHFPNRTFCLVFQKKVNPKK